MDLNNRENRSHSERQEASHSPAQDYRSSDGPVNSKGKQSLLWVIVGLVIVALAVVAGLTVMNKNDDTTKKANTAAVNQNSDKPWQAIFLTNGQVYFGHIKSEADKTIMLENVYYLQVEQRLQPPENKNAQPAISLVKLGRSELHCPVDEMTINRDQVLFWEELKDESRVVKAINEYLKTDDVTKKCYETSKPASTNNNQ